MVDMGHHCHWFNDHHEFKSVITTKSYRMKKIIYFLAVLALMCSCEKDKPGPHRAEMEAFAKANIPNPDTYEFDFEGTRRQYSYAISLTEYRLFLEKLLKEPGADTAAIQAEDDRIQEAYEKAGSDIACYEYSLHFWHKGGQDGKMPLPGVVVARYDANDKLMVMTMKPDTLTDDPAMNMMIEKGWLKKSAEPQPDYQDMILEGTK